MYKLKNLFIFLGFVVGLSACTPQDTILFWQDLGVELTQEEAEFFSESWNNQDCLPDYDADQYIECAITDAHAAHNLGRIISIEQWARVAWCESKLDPEIKNQSGSSALGLFQFLTSTWNDTRDRLGAPWAYDRTNPRSNAYTAAFLVDSLGSMSPWNASRGCWA